MPGFTVHKILEAESVLVRDLPLSQLRLQNQKAVPWLILVPRRLDAREIYKLPSEDREQLMEEIAGASSAIDAIWSPFKINVASLGNLVPQIHVHVVGRWENDPAWPKPVWGNLPPAPYADAELAAAKKKLEDYFSKANL
jgi:diadenosine tetraphosphate (Ap4A) HIT family hydrolase